MRLIVIFDYRDLLNLFDVLLYLRPYDFSGCCSTTILCPWTNLIRSSPTMRSPGQFIWVRCAISASLAGGLLTSLNSVMLLNTASFGFVRANTVPASSGEV